MPSSDVVSQSYVERAPLPALAGAVSSVWIQHVAPGADPHTQRHIPTGGVDVLCKVGAAPRIVGPHTGPRVEVLAPGTTTIGLRFRPGAAPAALGLPASEVADLELDAGELWGDAGGALAESVASAASAEAALSALERDVAGRMARAAPPDPLIAEAVRQLHWRSEDISSLTESLYISERQLRRRFQEAVGFAPKAVHRTLRFQEFLAIVQYAIAAGRAPTDDGVARLAAEAGYADQSHLHRECLRLTGLTPREFLGATEAACACGHDHSASFAPLLRSRPRPPAAP